jgi:uncharacterized protein YjbI with pentapeptide repeats
MYNSNKFTTQYVTINTRTVNEHPEQLINDNVLIVNIPQDIARIPNVSLSVVSCDLTANSEVGAIMLKSDNVASNYVGNDNSGCILTVLDFAHSDQGAGALHHYDCDNSGLDLSYSNLRQMRVYFEYIDSTTNTTQKITLLPGGAGVKASSFVIVFKLCYENTEEINKQYREQINPHLV